MTRRLCDRVSQGGCGLPRGHSGGCIKRRQESTLPKVALSSRAKTPEVSHLAKMIEDLIHEAPKNLKALRAVESIEDLYKEVSGRFTRLAFAKKQGIKTSIAREAAELATWIAFYVHRLKETHGKD